MALITLEGMEFYAYHGCSEDEKKVGIWFTVDVMIDYPSERAEYTDQLDKAINYQDVYTIVAEEMTHKSNLIEHVAYRIKERITKKFLICNFVNVRVAKMSPPLGGKLDSVSVYI
jgi:dihydroneopterin aldolase